MRSRIVNVRPRKNIIAKSSWPKKELADDHLEALLFCEFACRYCSSNAGLHLKFLKKSIQRAVKRVTGKPFDPHNAEHIVIGYRDVVKALDREVSRKRRPPTSSRPFLEQRIGRTDLTIFSKSMSMTSGGDCFHSGWRRSRAADGLALG